MDALAALINVRIGRALANLLPTGAPLVKALHTLSADAS
jgi:hypothetical protein